MSKAVKAIPDGYHTITPYLCVDGAAKAIDFYKRAFDAKELFSMPDPSGKIGHAELQIGSSRMMIADEYPEQGFRGPRSLGGTPVQIYMYVEDVDSVVKKAADAGAKITRPVEDQFYGDRSGTVLDPFGHAWHVSTHKEDLSPEELEKRARAHAQKAQQTQQTT